MAVNIKVRDDWIGWSNASTAVPSSLHFLHAIDDGFASYPLALSTSTPKLGTPHLPDRYPKPSIGWISEEVSNTQASSVVPYVRIKRSSSFASQPSPQNEAEEALPMGGLAHNQQTYHDVIKLKSEDEGACGWASDSGEELSERTGHKPPSSHGELVTTTTPSSRLESANDEAGCKSGCNSIASLIIST